METQRYEFLERIATGGMAEVFRARASGAHGFQKIVAIKRVRPSLANDPSFEEWFIEEAKLAVGLTHANIVQVLDFGRIGPSLFLVMEHVDGLDLQQLLERLSRPVPLAAAAYIAVELAKGLQFAHERGVIHRDLSPSNLLLSRAGEVKLADFGVAISGARRSGERRIAGKWPYMSPEQTEGRTLDGRSDLFSAGSVLHELFTGRPLFVGPDPPAIAELVRTMPIPPPSSARPELEPAFDEVVMRALARDPAGRYASAAELLRALVAASHAAQLVATPADVAQLVAEVAPPAGNGLDARVMQALEGKSPRGARRTEREPARRLGTIVRAPSTAGGLSHFRPETEPAAPRSSRRRVLLGVAAASLAGLAFAAAVEWRTLVPQAPLPVEITPEPAPSEPPPPLPSPRAEALPAPAPAPAREPATVHEPSRARYGRVDLFVEPWASVYFHDHKIADAPVRGLRLPVGHHRLKLVNPVLHQSRTVEIDVPSGRPYHFTLP